jgi:hypothetical protein
MIKNGTNDFREENPHPSARINAPKKSRCAYFVVRINQNYPTGLQVAPEHKALAGAIGSTELFSRAIAVPPTLYGAI